MSFYYFRRNKRCSRIDPDLTIAPFLETRERMICYHMLGNMETSQAQKCFLIFCLDYHIIYIKKLKLQEAR